MTLPLASRTIALAEGRQLEELAGLLEKEGARTLRCPLLAILDAPDEGPALAWLHALSAGQFAWVILLTGEGVRRLVALAERHGLRDAVVAALRTTNTITRGPKPVQALRDLAIQPTVVAQAPTSDGVIVSLRAHDLRGKAVGVQLYGDSNPALTSFLETAGAVVYTVQPYVYAPASDAERIVTLIQEMAAGRVDALVFTSSPQVDRLFAVAEAHGLVEVLRDGLTRTPIASVGPVLTQHLQDRGVAVSISPEQGFVMKNLVQHIKRALGRSA